jgi:glycosyltransferase involved in cell wall biosynthesis
MDKCPLYVSLPRGVNFGWGVCGIHLTLNFAQLADVTYITDAFTPEDIGDEKQYERLSRLWISRESLDRWEPMSEEALLDHPILQAMEGKSLKPLYMRAQAPKVLGYTFFESPYLTSENVAWAKEYYDLIVAGSTWCRDVLREHGIQNTDAIIQGVDTDLFHPRDGEKGELRDCFVVFSGGKLELRKGQDLVIRAFKILQDRHEDVVLINAWYNLWDESTMTMRFSPYIRFNMPPGDYVQAIETLVHANGIDPRRVITLTPCPHARMAEVYHNTDCGLFPNRCEGGTNLVLMEYMACGKPAIASFSTGHRDVLTDANAIPIRTCKSLSLKDQKGNFLERWEDPDLEEIVEKLEWAYQHRDALKDIGRQAAADMAQNTWDRAARAFLRLMFHESQ